MGFKKSLKAFELFNASHPGTMTGTSTIHSAKTQIQQLDNVGLQISWTGTAVGTISVECSNDDVTYYSLTFSPALTQPAGTAGGYLVDLNQNPFIWVRVSYVNSSGSGTLSAILSAKDVN